MTIQKQCEKLKDEVINTHNQYCCSSSSITKHSCDQESLPEIINKNIDSCQILQLLCEIEECCSKEPSDKINDLLKQLKTFICSLTKEIERHSLSIKYNQENFKYCAEKLNIERGVSKNEDTELCRIKTDLPIMADHFTQTIQHNNFVCCNINEVSEDLASRKKAYNELLNKSEELKEELNNEKFCLNMMIDQNKCAKRESSEKYQIIEAGILMKKELEIKLSILEKKLGKLEKLNNSCNKKCNDLIIQNMNLENDLKDEKHFSSKKAIYIDDLRKQIHDLEIIIKGIEDHKMLYIEEISKVKNDKSVAELKLNEYNNIIKTQKNELVIARSKLEYAEESLKNKNDYQNQKIQQLEHDNKKFEKEAQYYKVQLDFLTNKCLLNDKDLTESRNIIKSLEVKIDAFMEELNMIFDDLSKESNYLKRENSKLLEDIIELNKSIKSVNKKKNSLRNDLATCNEKLSIATDEISNFFSETKYLNTKLKKVTDKLICIERELEETKLKLNQETFLKEKINEKYCSIKYECTYPQEKCQTADDHRHSDNNIISCKVKEDEQTIHFKLVDVGSQTHPDLCQPITASTNCDLNINNIRQCDKLICSCDSDKISNNPCQLDLKKSSICVNSSDDYSCSVKLKNITKCFGVFCDKENLQCQLNEMKLLLKKKEKAAKKELCDTKQIHYNKEIILSKCLDDTKEQCQKQLDEANVQLETYETAILYKEYELKNFQIREHQYKMALEQLNEIIKNKDKKIEYEQKQIPFACNNMKDNQDQLISLQKTELEKFNEHKPDKNFQLLTNDYNVQYEKDLKIDNKLEKPQPFIKKQRFSTKQNVKNNICVLKISKTLPKTKSKKYGPKLNLPCCIGSKNPCNRQKSLNVLLMNQLKSEYRVSRNNLETSEISSGPME